MKKGVLLIVFIFSLIVVNAQITFNGDITEGDWGTALSTSSGGPTNGFGAGHELNAIYADGDATNLYLGIAGNVSSGNRILVFIDSKTGGYNNGDFGRTSAPAGLNNFNSGTTFDSGFLPDYCLVIGTNGSGEYYFDLFTLAGTAGGGGGSSTFLGTEATEGLGASPANSDNTKGFEVTIAKTAIGYTSGDVKVFAAYTGESGYLNNQFLTPAGSGQGAYTNSAVNFNSEPPNPVTITAASLPVEFTKFSATPHQKEIALNWQTATEKNNSHFEVEQSTDGKNYRTIGEVAGAGTTLEVQNYEFMDANPAKGMNYYRLKQVDWNGDFEYSDVAAVEFSSDLNAQFFPNPVKNELTINTTAQDVSIFVYNMTGQLVKQINRISIDGQYNLNMSELMSGMYQVQLIESKTGNSLAQQRVVKQ